MKCTIIPQCETVSNLIWDIDLRVDQTIRLKNIAAKMLPLNDGLGQHHISVNLFYKQAIETHHTNLPAFVTETETERIFNVLFPADTYATILTDGQNVKINKLEYHIDKITETVTEISGIANINDRIIYGFPIEGGSETGIPATVDAILFKPLSQLLQAIDNNIPAVVISTDGEYVSYNLTHTADKKEWHGIVGKTYFTHDVDDNVVYNHQYYEFSTGFQGNLNDSYTRYWRTKTLADKNSIIQQVDLSISAKDSLTNTVSNTAGTGFILETATNTEAGLMSTDDRKKMTELFNGTMLDSKNPAGYHRHNYLEMSDLPPVIEFAAASYEEFKSVLKKAKQEVAKGKFARIIQTANWIRTDDETFNLTGVTLENIQGSCITVTGHPLKLTGRCSIQLLYLVDTSSVGQDNKLMLEFIETNPNDSVTIEKLYFANCFGTGTAVSPIIKLTGNIATGIIINKFQGNNYNNVAYGNRPIIIETNRISDSLNIHLFNCELKGNIETYLKLNNIPATYGLLLNTDSSYQIKSNLNITPYLNQIQKTFSQIGVAGLTPAPQAGQTDQYHVLCGDGIWRDIRTMINS